MLSGEPCTRRCLDGDADWTRRTTSSSRPLLPAKPFESAKSIPEGEKVPARESIGEKGSNAAGEVRKQEISATLGDGRAEE